MAEEADGAIAKIAASAKSGSIVAAAGCGKTEQIARATQLAVGRRLILTHTNAGVDALRSRLERHSVRKEKFRIETIAGWCLRYAASFPKRSGLACTEPRGEEWNKVYECAARLLESGAIASVLRSSYAGVFVDEYQDCSGLQHKVIKRLAKTLPVCVFGDPLQAIFDFKGQEPVDWDADVFPAFEKVGELVTPWRWSGNKDLGGWLSTVRGCLEAGEPIYLANRPACVTWVSLPDDSGARSATITATCKRMLGDTDGTIVVIGDARNINARAAVAKNLAKVGFSIIEPLGCARLHIAAKSIDETTDFARLEATMAFVAD
jgi:hypothetical protein